MGSRDGFQRKVLEAGSGGVTKDGRPWHLTGARPEPGYPRGDRKADLKSCTGARASKTVNPIADVFGLAPRTPRRRCGQNPRCPGPRAAQCFSLIRRPAVARGDRIPPGLRGRGRAGPGLGTTSLALWLAEAAVRRSLRCRRLDSGKFRTLGAQRPAPPADRATPPPPAPQERAVRDPVRPGFLRRRWLPGGRGPNGGRRWSPRGGRTARAPARRAPGCRRPAASARWECPRAGGAGRWGSRPDVLLSPSDSGGRGTAGSALASPVRARR